MPFHVGAPPARSSWLAACFAIAAAIAIHLAILARFWVNAPVMDDYDSILSSIVAMHRATSWNEWWRIALSLANEHRAVTTRLLPLALANTAGSVDFRVLALTGTIFMAGTFAFIWFEHRRRVPPLVAAAGVFLLFQWSYNEALLQASGAIPHLGVVFFAFASLFFATRAGYACLFACLAFGVLAAFSQANGLLALPLAAAGCVLTGLHRRAALLALAAVAIWSIYFIGYAKPPNHPSPLFALQSPLTTLRLFLIVVGGFTPSLDLAQASGATMLGTIAWLGWKRHWRLHPTVLLWIAFVLASAAAVTAGRAGFGLFFGSRYAVNATLLAILILFALPSLGRPWNDRLGWLALATAVGLSAAITYVSIPQLKDRAFNAGLLAQVSENPSKFGLTRFVGMHHHSSQHAANVLQQASAEGLYEPRRVHLELPRVSAEKSRPIADRRTGSVDAFTRQGTSIVIDGWTDPPLAYPGQSIVVHAMPGPVSVEFDKVATRIDVALALRDTELLLSGFRIVAKFESEDMARAQSSKLCLYATTRDGTTAVVERRDVRCD